MIDLFGLKVAVNRGYKRVLILKVRKTLIDDIIIKHKLVKPRIDTGRRRKRTTRKDLDKWKQKRARHLEGWKKKKKKRRFENNLYQKIFII